MLTRFLFISIIHIILNDKVNAALLKRVDGPTQGELSFCEVNQYKGVNQKMQTVSSSGNTHFAKR